jgi:ribonuclease E
MRAEVAKETVEAVRAVLPMDVAAYLLNQKRKEIALLEDDYHLTIQVLGNPAARQNEYSIEFIRREVPFELPAATEKGRGKEADTTTQRDKHDERSAAEEKKPQLVVAVAETPAPVATINGHAPPPILAVARGRVFWRLSATTRRLELAQMSPMQRVAISSERTGRSTTGRIARRARTWWRRRSQSPQNAETAKKREAVKAQNR